MSKKVKESTLLNNKTTTEIKLPKPDKLKLSPKAKVVAEKLKLATDSPDKGKIAAIDPATGEYYIGKSIIEAVKEGRSKTSNPKAVFYSVRIGFPSVHVLKKVALSGDIYQERFPKVRTSIINKELHFENLISNNAITYDFIIDTGFTGSLIIDPNVIDEINADFISYDEVTLAGGTKVQVKEYSCRIWINSLIFDDILVTIMPNEFLIGMDFMRQISKRTIFDFENDKIIFED